MKFESYALIALSGVAAAVPTAKMVVPPRVLYGREVPQEHSHNKFLASVKTSLDQNNPQNIVDPVFGLLGNAAAASGAGSVTDLDCLQQATADQAFTNAKAAGDVDGMVGALIYRALERNTGSVGLASVLCTSVTATNPEIAAVSQHQDPASANAASINKNIVLELAKQIASVGGDPQLALQSGTFAPGTIGDPTAAGHTCDTADDTEGCIFTQNLLVEDATAAEISAAVSGAAATTTPAPTAVVTDSASACAVTTVIVTSTVTAGAAAATTTTGATATTNIQTFTGTLGGPAPPVTSTAGSDRPFSVNGSTFVNAGAALQRSCSIQHNACADAANSGQLAGGVSQCDAQESACNAADSG